jgi:hypothetical protein
MCRHEALADAALAAHHGDHAPDRAESLGNTMALRRDLVRDAGAIWRRELVVRPDAHYRDDEAAGIVFVASVL